MNVCFNRSKQINKVNKTNNLVIKHQKLNNLVIKHQKIKALLKKENLEKIIFAKIIFKRDILAKQIKGGGCKEGRGSRKVDGLGEARIGGGGYFVCERAI